MEKGGTGMKYLKIKNCNMCFHCTTVKQGWICTHPDSPKSNIILPKPIQDFCPLPKLKLDNHKEKPDVRPPKGPIK